jgi:uncharacterized membrane protein
MKLCKVGHETTNITKTLAHMVSMDNVVGPHQIWGNPQFFQFGVVYTTTYVPILQWLAKKWFQRLK